MMLRIPSRDSRQLLSEVSNNGGCKPDRDRGKSADNHTARVGAGVEHNLTLLPCIILREFIEGFCHGDCVVAEYRPLIVGDWCHCGNAVDSLNRCFLLRI